MYSSGVQKHNPALNLSSGVQKPETTGPVKSSGVQKHDSPGSLSSGVQKLETTGPVKSSGIQKHDSPGSLFSEVQKPEITGVVNSSRVQNQDSSANLYISKGVVQKPEPALGKKISINGTGYISKGSNDPKIPSSLTPAPTLKPDQLQQELEPEKPDTGSETSGSRVNTVDSRTESMRSAALTAVAETRATGTKEALLPPRNQDQILQANQEKVNINQYQALKPTFKSSFVLTWLSIWQIFVYSKNNIQV